MEILMRNTVFKTTAFAGLFLCVLALGGVFPSITASVHATHNQGFIHAEDVGTDQGKLEQFVKAAIDAYYIDFIFRQCEFPDNISQLMTASGVDLATTPVETIKGFIPLAAGFPDLAMNIGEYCDYTQPFSEVFRSEDAEDGEWESGSIYLFVMDDQGTLLFVGADPDSEGEVLRAIDAGGRNVAQAIIGKAKENPKEGGFVDYCWDDPATEDDDVGDSDPLIAPGDSWKMSYVVDPFELLGSPKPAGSSNVIFGSGIYPKTGTPPKGCDGDGMVGDEEEMDDMDDMEEPVEESMDEPREMEMPTGTVDSVSGGGCAIMSGSDGTPQNTAFNLLLSALFLAVSFGNRAVSRWNGNSS
ncbi:MAG: cache domain-containing protein [Candidatus Dadabacteria bacterium]|nr:cache domain-containing protein [Candidatus Dadabacteria bacterium]